MYAKKAAQKTAFFHNMGRCFPKNRHFWIVSPFVLLSRLSVGVCLDAVYQQVKVLSSFSYHIASCDKSEIVSVIIWEKKESRLPISIRLPITAELPHVCQREAGTAVLAATS